MVGLCVQLWAIIKLCFCPCCVPVTNIADKNNVEEEQFILVHDFRGLSSRSADSIALGPV